jgi:hypothetical protein
MRRGSPARDRRQSECDDARDWPVVVLPGHAASPMRIDDCGLLVEELFNGNRQPAIDNPQSSITSAA